MSYKVSELGKILGINRASIYKKIKVLDKELQPYIQYENNVLKISEAGIEILKIAFSKRIPDVTEQQSDDTKRQNNKDEQQSDNDDDYNKSSEFKELKAKLIIEKLEKENIYLTKQLSHYEESNKKNLQLMEGFTEMVKSDQKLIENMQVLLKREQEQNQLLISQREFIQDTRPEGHYEKIDNQLHQIQERMNEIAAAKQEKKGFLKRLFN